MTDWQKLWKDGESPWDLGAPHPETIRLVEILSAWSIVPKSVLIPGCGRAHDASAFLNEKTFVTGVDLSDVAIAEAKRLFGDYPNLRLVVSSNESFCAEHPNQFDLVFDRAMLCALREDLRIAYIDGLHHALRTSGVFCSLAFESFKFEVSGPPFKIDADEMTRLFMDRFTLLGSYRVKNPSPLPIIDQETLWIWKKRD